MIQMAFAVFIGGGVGSVARWLLSAKYNMANLAIPMGTLIANLVGAFIIGLAFALFSRFTNVDPIWKLLITTGFCGGLTTFSTFSYEVMMLLQEGRLAWAGLNVLVNLAGSFLMTAFAFWLVAATAHQ
ncbi:fluoride efflux transporter CrcB [Citrobacter sp. JGM124]|uniref:fluoride efflux transporter CrcB n=1 Tax=Citrobacter sp. JGM124 TaxID=2799789 RepID=UPI001BAB7B47|nr:fluoride efflux transporter CrcB [Citrobacter sp. JGM124]